MLITGQLCRFVSEIIKTVNEEMNEKTLWEFWLHKDWERSWPEFRKALDDKPQNAAPTRQETADIVKDSMSIMATFRLPGGGVEDGAISVVRGDSDRRDESEPDINGYCPESGHDNAGS